MKWLLPLLLATPSLALWNPLKRQDTGSKVPCYEVFNCNQDTQYCNGNTGECVQFDDCRGTPGSCGVGKYCVPLAPDNSFNYTCSDSPPVSSSSSAAPSSTSSAPPSGPSKSCNGYSPLGTCGDGAFCNGFGHGMFGCLYYNDCRGPNVVCGSGESCKAVAPQFPFSAIQYECIANGASAPVPTDGPNRPNIPVDAQGYPIVCDPNADACPNGGFCKPTPPLDYYRETNNFCDYYFDCRNPYNVCPSGQVCQSAGFEWINCVDANSTSSSMSMSGMSSASNSASTTSSASSTTPSNLPDVNDCRNTGCSHHETCGLVSSGLNVTYGCFDSSRPLDCRNGGCTSDQVCEYYQKDTTSGYVCFNNASLPTGQDCRTGSGCPGGICGLNGQGFVCLFNTTSPSMSSSMVSSIMSSGSSMVSMVSSAFSSGPISSPAPTQMSSAAGPGPAPSVVSQTGSPAPAPSSGGSNPAPSQGGNSPAPSQGGNSSAPSQGGNSPAPSQGGNSPAPSQGGNSPAPSQGGNSPAPSQGSGGSGGNPMGNTIDLVAIYNLLHQIKKELDEVKADVKAIKAKIGA